MAVFVRQNLHFNVLGLAHEFLQKHCSIAERSLRLRRRLLQQRLQLIRLLHHPHSPSTTTEGGFDDQRKANFLCRHHCLFLGFHGLRCALECRHLQAFRHMPGRRFITHHFQHLRIRPDENNSFARAGFRKLRILRKKSIPRVNGIHPLLLRQRHDPLDIQISPQRSLLRI